MGCWNEVCALTGVMIREGDPVVGLWCTHTAPLPFFWYSTYNDYGWFNDVQWPSEAMREAMFDWLSKHVTPLKRKHDVDIEGDKEVDPSALTWDLLGETSHRGRLFVDVPRYQTLELHECDSPEFDSDAVVNRTERAHIHHVLVHREAWDRIVDLRIEPSRYGQYKNFDPYNWDIMAYQLKDYLDAMVVEPDEVEGLTEVQRLSFISLKEMAANAGQFMNWFIITMEMNPNTAYVNDIREYVQAIATNANLESDEKIRDLTPFFQVRWLLMMISHMGLRLRIPTHIGQSDTREFSKEFAAIVLNLASRRDEYSGLSMN